MPGIALVPSQWLSSLNQTESVRSLTGLIPAETLQAYQPAAVQSWMAGDRLYGVPWTLDLPALYYNKRLISDPARTLDDLLSEGAAEWSTALNVSVDQAYWGMAAFGGRLFGADDRAVLDQGGFAEWLGWLQEARIEADAVLDTDAHRLRDLFLNEQVAYLVGGPDALGPAERALGRENFGVTRLPTGPVAESSPLLTSRGFVIPSDTGDEARALALLFIESATGVESQKLLMEEGRKVPVNIAVDYSADPSISAFLERSSSAVVYPNNPEMAAVEEFAGKAYEAILSDPPLSQEELEALVLELTEMINVTNGFLPSQPTDEGLKNDQ